MKVMKDLKLMMAIFITSVLGVRAQSTVQIIDLMPVTQIMSDSTGHPDTTSLKEHIRFKINTMAMADSACIQIGSSAGASDVLQIHCVFTESGGQFFLNYGGQQFAAGTYEAYVEIPVSTSQLRNSKYVSLFVWDKSRLKSNKLSSKYN
jgi:hypothetical protein